MNAKRVVLGAVFCILLTGLSGCTAPLALQELSGVAPVSFNPTGMGKGDSAWLVRYDDVVQATLRAGEMLRLNLEKKEIGEDQTVFRYIDSRGKKIDIKIERRSETVTYARFSVGLFGSKSMGQLLVRQIIFELNEEGKFLREWKPQEAD